MLFITCDKHPACVNKCIFSISRANTDLEFQLAVFWNAHGIEKKKAFVNFTFRILADTQANNFKETKRGLIYLRFILW